ADVVDDGGGGGGGVVLHQVADGAEVVAEAPGDDPRGAGGGRGFPFPPLGIFDPRRYFRAVFSLIPDFNAATPNDIPRDNNFFKRRTWPS
ncbi:MAG: hypothetical protein ACK5EA_16365, partial [Planctomycetaceae bacterium]